MTDPEKPALDDLLSSFALGPAWARQSGKDEKPRQPKFKDQGRERSGQRGDRDQRGDRGDRFRDDRKFKGDRKFKDRGGKFEPRQHQEPEPAKDIRVSIIPDQASIHLIVKEIQQVARVYPLFDIAKTLLTKYERCRAIFETQNDHPELFRGRHDDSLFLTREEAMHHLWNSELRQQFIVEETIEVDPPSGNFQIVAKCGLSGEWLGPPNFHTYQANLRRIHRERFAHMPFDAYTAKVRSERGEEAVNEWLESMKTKTHWRLKDSAEDEPWIDDRSQAERLLATHCFDKAFDRTPRAELPGAVNFKHLSPALGASLRLASSHARRHPAMLIPAICKSIETEHLPVFKRKGKLYTGPVRPHPLPADATLAPRPAQMIDWIRNNTPAKLEGLWKALLPEGSTAPPAEYAADLFWLLTQGHILLFTDDLLVVQELRPPQEPAKKKEKKKPAAKDAAGTTPAAEAEEPVAEPSSADAPAAETETSETVEPTIGEPVETIEETHEEPAVEAAAEPATEEPSDQDPEPVATAEVTPPDVEPEPPAEEQPQQG